MIVLRLLAFFSASVAFSSAGRVVCYFTSWTIYRPGDGKYTAQDVDPNLCTHVLYAFVGLGENGTLQVLDDWEMTELHELEHLVSLKTQNPNLKLIVSMGGWNEGSFKYSEMAKNPNMRNTLVQSVIKFLDENNFDGFDLDWEYPGQRNGDAKDDPANFIKLLGELKTALNAKGYILSAAVSGLVQSIDISYPDGKAVSDNVDMINVVTYDYHGHDDMSHLVKTGVRHPSPLYPSHLDITDYERSLNVAAGIQHWLDIGADPAKINIAISTYGRSFTLTNQSNTDLYAPVSGPGKAGPLTLQLGVLGYNEICRFYTNLTYVWDDEQKVPHRDGGGLWIGYDDIESVKLKIQYANEKNLGGAMVYSLDADDFLGKCGDGKYPLLRVINKNLK